MSRAELTQLLIDSFFKLGKRLDLDASIDSHKADLFINEVFKYQGSMKVDDFEEAFSMYGAGTLQAESLRPSTSPMFVSRLMKVYKERKYGKYEHKFQPQETNADEQNWKRFFNHIQFYRSLPANPDWISLYNHCVLQDWIPNQPPIPAWNYQSYLLAQRNVIALIYEKYGEMITNNNVYGGGNKGMKGLGTQVRESW
jgi:hypothetical protein